jgi:hypothetical protein
MQSLRQPYLGQPECPAGATTLAHRLASHKASILTTIVPWLFPHWAPYGEAPWPPSPGVLPFLRGKDEARGKFPSFACTVSAYRLTPHTTYSHRLAGRCPENFDVPRLGTLWAREWLLLRGPAFTAARCGQSKPKMLPVAKGVAASNSNVGAFERLHIFQRVACCR